MESSPCHASPVHFGCGVSALCSPPSFSEYRRRPAAMTLAAYGRSRRTGRHRCPYAASTCPRTMSTAWSTSRTKRSWMQSRAQVASASHAVLVVHVRVPGGIRSNMVARDGISEDPSHLVPWFDLAKKKEFRVGLIAILFSDDDWGWGGYWKPRRSGGGAGELSRRDPAVPAGGTDGGGGLCHPV